MRQCYNFDKAKYVGSRMLLGAPIYLIVGLIAIFIVKTASPLVSLIAMLTSLLIAPFLIGAAIIVLTDFYKETCFYIEGGTLYYDKGRSSYVIKEVEDVKANIFNITITGSITSSKGRLTSLTVPNAYGESKDLVSYLKQSIVTKDTPKQSIVTKTTSEVPVVSTPVEVAPTPKSVEVSTETIEKLNEWGTKYNISEESIQRYLEDFKSTIIVYKDLEQSTVDKQALRSFPIYFDLGSDTINET